MLKIVLCNTDLQELENIYHRAECFFNKNISMLIKFGLAMDLLDFLASVNGLVNIVIIAADLDGMDGIDVAKKMRMFYPAVRIILTGRAQTVENRIEDIFDIAPEYFMYSPVAKENAEKCFSFVFDRIMKDNARFIELTNKNGIRHIPAGSITYVESNKRKVIVYEEDGRCSEYYCKLDEIESKLGFGFLRCHQSYLVNMLKIRLFVEDALELYSGELIPIPHKKYYTCKREYLNYITNINLK